MSELHVEVSGTGPDLVLLHGWGLNVRVWDGLVEELRDHFRMIAIDLPGHGRSRASSGQGTPAEQAWLIHQALSSVSDRYSLLGWSLGGQIALDLAAAMPWQIEKLVLVATTPKFVAAPDWPYGMSEATITKMAAQLRTDYERTVGDFLELQVRGSLEGAGALYKLGNALFVHGHAAPEALQAGLNTLATSDLRATLSHVMVPTLVITGQNDRITAPAASRSLANALPNAKYVEMRRAAHAPFLSHRTEFAKLVLDFLRGGTDAVLQAAVLQAADTHAADTATRDAAPRAASTNATHDDGAMRGPGSTTQADGGSRAFAAPQAASTANSAQADAAPRAADTSLQPDDSLANPSLPSKNKRIKGRAKKKMQRGQL
jgi:pimeloyl-[acyl-carrier protein] methyl ester esterase